MHRGPFFSVFVSYDDLSEPSKVQCRYTLILPSRVAMNYVSSPSGSGTPTGSGAFTFGIIVSDALNDSDRDEAKAKVIQLVKHLHRKYGHATHKPRSDDYSAVAHGDSREAVEEQES